MVCTFIYYTWHLRPTINRIMGSFLRNSPFQISFIFRFILTPKTEMKCLCLQAMTIVYGRHFEDIGPFHDTKYIVAMLDRTLDKVERDRLLLFLNKLILHKENAAALIQANGINLNCFSSSNIFAFPQKFLTQYLTRRGAWQRAASATPGWRSRPSLEPVAALQPRPERC